MRISDCVALYESFTIIIIIIIYYSLYNLFVNKSKRVQLLSIRKPIINDMQHFYTKSY